MIVLVLKFVYVVCHCCLYLSPFATLASPHPTLSFFYTSITFSKHLLINFYHLKKKNKTEKNMNKKRKMAPRASQPDIPYRFSGSCSIKTEHTDTRPLRKSAQPNMSSSLGAPLARKIIVGVDFGTTCTGEIHQGHLTRNAC